MKVLLTHELFPPEFAGGGEYVALETALGLRRRGIDARVVTTGDPSVTEYQGIPTTRLPLNRYRMNLAVSAIARHARDVDIIHTFNYHACLPSLIAGRLTGKPVVCLVLGLFGPLWREMSGRFAGSARQVWEQFVLTRGFDRMIFISEYSRDQGLSIGIPRDRAIVNEPGIQLDHYSPAPIKDDVVFFTGKLDVRKGIDEVMAAARALPDVRFRIMGWGERASELQRSATGNVEWVPYPQGLAGAELRKEFSRARIFLFPSKGETFGIVLAEAMASGCAIVSSVPLGFEGVRVEPGDRDGIVQAIRTLWNDRNLSLAMGRQNIQRAQYYNWERHIDILEHTYKMLLHRRGTDITTRQAS